jgi:hypothetical protein
MGNEDLGSDEIGRRVFYWTFGSAVAFTAIAYFLTS